MDPAKGNENQGNENHVKKNLARCGEISIVSGFGSHEGDSFFDYDA